MPFNYFDTHTLIASVEELNPTHSFLRDRYFPTNEASDLFSTDDVLIEYRDGNRKLAPFVVPRKGGMTVLRDGQYMERYTPPFIAPQRSLTIDDLKKRGFGEALYANLTPSQRQGVIILRDIDEMRTMTNRRMEQMASETLLTNGCVMKHYTDEIDKFEEKEIRFYDGADNPAIYTPSLSWETAEWKKIYEDIAAMIRMLTVRGLPVSDLLVSSDVAAALLHNEGFQKELDNRNYNIGGVDPVLLPAGAAKIARINVYGRMIDVISYEDTYTDDKGDVAPFIPEGRIVLTAPAAGRTLFGAVTQLEQADDDFHTYTGMYIPKYLSDAGKNTRSITLTSCPLMIPNNKNPWTAAKVIF